MSRAKPDRRISRTQHSLHRALNTLILEKGYEATTITDIVSRADVGRSTFYAHHGSKEGLLLYGLHHLQNVLMDQRLLGGESNPPLLGFSRVFFEHLHEYRDVFQSLRADECGAIVTRKMKRILTEVVRQDLRHITSENTAGQVPRDAIVQFTVDALFSILLWWLEQKPTLSPVQADALFRRLTLPALAAGGFTPYRNTVAPVH